MMSKIDGVTFVGSDTIGVSKPTSLLLKKNATTPQRYADVRCRVVALLYIYIRCGLLLQVAYAVEILRNLYCVEGGTLADLVA